MNHIELFAGCGGLSLGLEAAGFDLLLANELSPMAAETFSYNFFEENLLDTHKKSKTLWLSSNYSRAEIEKRLREDPRTYPAITSKNSDLKNNISLKRKMLVGSITELNKLLENNPTITNKIKNAFLKAGQVDLVSGGPPCQSFSMAGMRQLKNDRNTLPWEFAKFVKLVQPKIALLENVTGILRPFKEGNNEFYAWYEIAKAFANINYIPLCLHVNAKFAGVAQNRPRFILIGIHQDIFKKLQSTFNEYEKKLFKQPMSFFKLMHKRKDLPYGELAYLDNMKEQDLVLFEKTFLHPLVSYKDNIFTVKDAIDDLRIAPEIASSEYVQLLNEAFKSLLSKKKMMNHELRNNGDHVRRRFRIYQILQQLPNEIRKEVSKVIKGQSNELNTQAFNILKEYDFLKEKNNYIRFKTKKELLNYLKEHVTKKQTQKALLADKPAPAALSIPDDACHYHHDELRTLTVREMARIQSFPDNFEFRSKVTTGGKMRQFEVPQYTQVGNAVPPLLGRALGLSIKELLSSLD